jgi:hypothetical protein
LVSRGEPTRRLPPRLETELTAGKVVVQHTEDQTFWTMNPDGSNRQRLTPPGTPYWIPKGLSPDGRQLSGSAGRGRVIPNRSISG